MKVAINGVVYDSEDQPLFVKFNEVEMSLMDPNSEGFIPSFLAGFPDDFDSNRKEQLTTHHYQLMGGDLKDGEGKTN